MNDDHRISLYEAKARLSALVRQVREGGTFVITVHGEPVAELRPLDPTRHPPSLQERLAQLAARGIVSPAARSPRLTSLTVGARKAGALKRFLESRE